MKINSSVFKSVGLSLFLLLSSCGQDGDSSGDVGNSISGTVTLPGGDIGSSSILEVKNTATKIDIPKRESKVIPGEYLVTMEEGMNAQAVQELKVGGQTLIRDLGIPSLGIWSYKVVQNRDNLSLQSSNKILNEIKKVPGVRSVEANRTKYLLSMPNDEYHYIQWDMYFMDIHRAWAKTTGKKVVVAVIDSGIVRHPDLNSNVLPGIDMIRDLDSAADGNGIDNDPTDLSTRYHGSHVAGTIAAVTNNKVGLAGMSWGAKILPVRAMGIDGRGDTEEIYWGAAWAAGIPVKGLPSNPNPAKVINMSLGGPGECSQFGQKVLNAIHSVGVITVVAAGNDTVDAATITPANCENVITVGATDLNNERANYSNYGEDIDLMAPGGDDSMKIPLKGGRKISGGIYSTTLTNAGRPNFSAKQGTSMAAPHVAGAVALLLGEQPNLKFNDVLSKLKAASQPIKCDVPNGCGAGLLNVAVLLGEGSPNPKLPKFLKTPITVVANYITDDGKIDRERRVVITLKPEKYKVTYKLKGITEGTYRVGAWQDTNENGRFDNGEPIRILPQKIEVSENSGATQNIDIKMKVFGKKNRDSKISISDEKMFNLF